MKWNSITIDTELPSQRNYKMYIQVRHVLIYNNYSQYK